MIRIFLRPWLVDLSPSRGSNKFAQYKVKCIDVVHFESRFKRTGSVKNLRLLQQMWCFCEQFNTWAISRHKRHSRTAQPCRVLHCVQNTKSTRDQKELRQKFWPFKLVLLQCLSSRSSNEKKSQKNQQPYIFNHHSTVNVLWNGRNEKCVLLMCSYWILAKSFNMTIAGHPFNQ